MENKPILCHFCNHPPFDTFGELALHLKVSKKIGGHNNRASQLWANKYLSRQKELDKKASFKKSAENRVVLTDEQKEAKRDTKYQLSGATKYVKVKCPRCHTVSRDFLPVEHVNNFEALKIDNCFVKMCEGCK